MKNLFALLILFGVNSFASDHLELKAQNYDHVIKTYSEFIDLDDQDVFCQKVEVFLSELYIILEQDNALITFLASTGSIVDYDFAGELNENKISDLFFLLNLQDTCELSTPMDLQRIDKDFERSILNTQILQMQFKMFAESRSI